MYERGVSRRAAEAIADVVPLAFVIANLATVRVGKGVNPGAVCAAALWHDDADWIRRQTDAREGREVVANIKAVREDQRAAAAADAERRAAESRARVADLTDGELIHAVLSHAETLERIPRRTLLTRLEQCRSDPRSSPLLIDAALSHLNPPTTAAACAAAAG